MWPTPPRTFGKAIKVCLTKYVVGKGRALRSEYLYFALFTFLVVLATGGVGDVLLFLPSLTMWVRRLHDIGKSAWAVLWILLPVISWIVLIVYAVRPGEPKPNVYGWGWGWPGGGSRGHPRMSHTGGCSRRRSTERSPCRSEAERTDALRTVQAHQRPKSASHGQGADGRRKGIGSISERPVAVADRAVPDRWVGDLMLGRGEKPPVATKEMAANARFKITTGIDMHFCDPDSTWQRGTSEDTNGLIWQYLPRSIDLATVSDGELHQIAAQLIERLREARRSMTPAAKLIGLLAMAG